MKNVITALLLCISIGASAQTMGNPMPNVSAEENPLQTINNTPGLCAIFRTWGFIGDSLCSGEMESRDETGALLDRCMAVCFSAAHSYTGEESAEIHCHGSPVVRLEFRRVLFRSAVPVAPRARTSAAEVRPPRDG